MASVLYRLGGWTYDRRRTVVAIWAAVVVVLIVLAVAAGGKVSNSFTVPGTESQQALNLLNKEFPGTGGATARIVFAAPAGDPLLGPQDRKPIAPPIRDAQRGPHTLGGSSAVRHSVPNSRNPPIALSPPPLS